MTDEEYKKFCEERKCTIGDVMRHLETLDPNAKICYMDCVEGLRNDCTYVRNDDLGKRFFYRVKKLRENDPKFEIDYVSENDVVML